jgi:hypothetical protein
MGKNGSETMPHDTGYTPREVATLVGPLANVSAEDVAVVVYVVIDLNGIIRIGGTSNDEVLTCEVLRQAHDNMAGGTYHSED